MAVTKNYKKMDSLNLRKKLWGKKKQKKTLILNWGGRQ